MTKAEFFDKIEKIYKRYKRINYHSKNILKDNFELIEYLVDNYDDLSLIVHINGYEIIGEKIKFNTNIGTFLTDISNCDDEPSKYINIDIDAYKFFETFLIKKPSNFINNIKDENNKIFIRYLQSYYLYRNLTDPNEAKRLFLGFSYDNYNNFDRVFNLECLNNPDFFDLYSFRTYRPNVYMDQFIDIYDNYFKFDNKNLIFSIIVLSHDTSRKSFILENIDEFKKFVIDHVSIKAKNNSYISLAYKYIIETGIIDYFEHDELEKMYLKNPYYYKLDSKRFNKVVCNIKNNSPLVKLDSETDETVHIRVHDYDLVDGLPFEIYKRGLDSIMAMNFKNTFLFNNEFISKLYRMYYKNYIDIMNKKGLKNRDNLKDFIEFLFNTNNLIKLYNNSNITIDELNNLERFLRFYDENTKNTVGRLKSNLRNISLSFYNEIINSKNSIDEINSILDKYNIDKDNIYSFIINNKFLYSKEKSGLINVLGLYYDLSIKFIDVLSIISEMSDREMTIDQILKEKDISRKDFNLIYEKSAKDNPILHEYISGALKRNKRLGFMKLCKYGYVVLNSNIISIKDYEEKFPNNMSYYNLIRSLSKTEIANKLIQKAQKFDDFNRDELGHINLELSGEKSSDSAVLKMKYKLI